MADLVVLPYLGAAPIVGVLGDPAFRDHATGDHPDNRDTIARIMDALAKAPFSGAVMRFFPRFATEEQLALVHDARYVGLVRRAAPSAAERTPTSVSRPVRTKRRRSQRAGSSPLSTA